MTERRMGTPRLAAGEEPRASLTGAAETRRLLQALLAQALARELEAAE